MSKSHNEAAAEKAAKHLDTPQDSASDNEESDSITDQSSSAPSEQQKQLGGRQKEAATPTGPRDASATTAPGAALASNHQQQHQPQHGYNHHGSHHHHHHHHHHHGSAPATQFSVQRSDTDGLRMRISAIRPATVGAGSAPAQHTNKSNHNHSPKLLAPAPLPPPPPLCDTTSDAAGPRHKQQNHNSHNNNNSNNNHNHISSNNHHHHHNNNNNNNNNSSSSNNNNTIESLKVKIVNSSSGSGSVADAGPNSNSNSNSTCSSSSKAQLQRQQTLQLQQQQLQLQQHQTKQRRDSKSSRMSLDAASSSAAAVASATSATPTTTARATATSASTTATATRAGGGAYPSDESQTDCSVATASTQVASPNAKHAKKLRVKRKKVSSTTKGALAHSKKLPKSLRGAQLAPPLLRAASFSTSDDDGGGNDPQPLQILHAKQQRAPRLLLTAINAKNGGGGGAGPSALALLKPVHTLVSTTASGASGGGGGGDNNIGLSSSDNELPDLVSAAIKRVENDSEDEDGGGVRVSRMHTRQLQQYQSTLLQDFMEKTQRLGQRATTPPARPPFNRLDVAGGGAMFTHSDLLAVTLHSNSQTESNASSGGGAAGSTKKRRGRPKKVAEAAVSLLGGGGQVAAINESADSGVISTTSTTQSTTPSPRMPSLATTGVSPLKAPPETTASAKPKIDMAYLDKRMYATERVLYPPPRNKRRQSLAAVAQQQQQQHQSTSSLSAAKECAAATSSAAIASAAAACKEEVQLDPVWRQIDVNKKFRRPSLSGYKSDGGGGNTTICSKVLAAKSDYGSFNARAPHHSHAHSHASGYKSDASAKSRHSTRSCASRRSRAKSCGYRSDCKDGGAASTTSKGRFRRRRRQSLLPTAPTAAPGNPSDEQDILQLAGLSLGQSSEESSEYVCKPSLERLPTTSVSKKYGEINRFVATGEYFGRGTSGGGGAGRGGVVGGGVAHVSGAAGEGRLCPKQQQQEDASSQDAFPPSSPSQRLLMVPREGGPSEATLPVCARRIKSRRSSVASYCSSYYSGTGSQTKRKRRRFRFPVDSKLLTEIEIITSTFGARCCIQSGGSGGSSAAGAGGASSGAAEKVASSSGSSSTAPGSAGGGGALKEKLLADVTSKLQQASSAVGGSGGSGGGGKREAREKRTLKKRKMSENLDFALLASAAAAGGNLLGVGGSGAGPGLSGGCVSSSALTPSSSGGGSSTKRRHKKTSSSSPDDHKLPLKKRHYLLTPGEKSTDPAVAAKLYASSAEAWAAAAAVAKTTASTKAQQQFGAKAAAAAKAAVTPKKRHLLLQGSATAAPSQPENAAAGSGGGSPLRIAVDGGAASSSHSISGGKLLDLSPISLSSLKQATEVVHKKRTRLEGLVSKIAHHSDTGGAPPSGRHMQQHHHAAPLTPASPQLDSETSSCPPPGVFEPTLELEIQIPPIAKLTEAASAAIIHPKSEVDSPLLALDVGGGGGGGGGAATKVEGTSRVVETLLNKTGGNRILRRKRKKYNRTGFPTIRRKKRKIHEHLLLDITPDIGAEVQRLTAMAAHTAATVAAAPTTDTAKALGEHGDGDGCDRVPQAGEASFTFMERANRTPRLSVVALERLQGTPTPLAQAVVAMTPAAASTPTSIASATRGKRKQKVKTEDAAVAMPAPRQTTPSRPIKRTKLRRTEAAAEAAVAPEPLNTRGRVRRSAQGADGEKRDRSVQEAPPSAPVSTATRSKTPLPRIITAKTLESKVKLPAGIDPNTNFSCKIRLKRRVLLASDLSLSSSANADRDVKAKEPPVAEAKEPPTKTSGGGGGGGGFGLAHYLNDEIDYENLDADAAAKDPELDHPEHDPLPPNDADTAAASAASDSSDEKSSTPTRRTSARIKKTFLPAGLLSDYYKQDQPAAQPQATHGKRGERRAATGNGSGSGSSTAIVPIGIVGAPSQLLPPPPYCERYLRRRRVDFQLPYDIYHQFKKSKPPSAEQLSTVPSWNYRKIRNNAYADSVRPNLAGFDHPICNCRPETCCGDDCLNRLVYTECFPPTCPARERCRNQIIQRYETSQNIELFMTVDKGWGVRSKRPIARGTYILEYVGEVVTERDFKDRMNTRYQLDTHHYCLHLDGGLVIDGHRMGSLGRFVNHSCEPNCEMQKWSVGGLSRMALFARRTIPTGEELSYDYNFALFNPAEGQACRCNAAQCRGVIGGKSQRVRPLPPSGGAQLQSVAVAVAPAAASAGTGGGGAGGASGGVNASPGRQRKSKAQKNAQQRAAAGRETKETSASMIARLQQLTEREKRLVRQHGVFLMRIYEKIRRLKGGTISPRGGAIADAAGAPAATSCVASRRPSTPSTLAAQISALCSQRSIKTRGLTLAVQDPEVERMARMAVVLRDICAALDALRDPSDEQRPLIAAALCAVGGAAACSAGGNKKRKALKSAQLRQEAGGAATDLKAVQSRIEHGYYKNPGEFDADVLRIMATARQTLALAGDCAKLGALDALHAAYTAQKQQSYGQLLELLGGDEAALVGFREAKLNPNAKQQSPIEEKENVAAAVALVVANGESEQATKAVATTTRESAETPLQPPEKVAPVEEAAAAVAVADTSSVQPPPPPPLDVELLAAATTSGEDIIRCICGLYKDEGVMIQCARCMVWQHTECTHADVHAEHYLCERCEPRDVDREIPLEDFTDDGHRYYLTLMRGTLHVRQGDAVYVLRDIPVRDDAGLVVPSQKHTYETIGDIDYNECDIFRVERLWKGDEGRRYIFGHHFLRPHETFHEPSRRFYRNEVVRVPLYEVVPIELVIGRCWVLDRTTFCKGRPAECVDEEHCYICELRVDKTARFFSKAKVNYPTCTKSYAFRKFAEKLKISKTYAPHDVDPAMLKTKRQKADADSTTGNSVAATTTTTTTNAISSTTATTTTTTTGSAATGGKAPQTAGQNSRKRQSSNSPANALHAIARKSRIIKTVKEKRTRLENVLRAIKLYAKSTGTSTTTTKNTHTTTAHEAPVDLSYLLSGRGARHRKAATTSAMATATTIATAPHSVPTHI